MNCLLYSVDLKNDEELIEHYIFYQKIDPNNRFFLKLFQSNKNCSKFRKCLRCDDFLTTSDFRGTHDFSKHYTVGYNDLFEDKPFDIVKTGRLLRFEITVNKHGGYFNFENSEEIVDDFLKNVHSRFKASSFKVIKCAFIIENIQQSAFENLRPIINTRWWTSDVYKAKYFNDFFLWFETKYFKQSDCKWYVWQFMEISQIYNVKCQDFKFREKERS